MYVQADKVYITLRAMLKTLGLHCCSERFEQLSNRISNYRANSGDAFDKDSYVLCNTMTVGVEASLELTLECTDPGSYQYLIVQSVDTNAEKLCIGEVCALPPGQYAVTIILL